MPTRRHPRPLAQTAIYPPRKAPPGILAIDVASQATVAATIHVSPTPETESPLVTISATIRALSSSRHVRRRPAPVKHFQPADRLGDSTMFSVHSKPNGQNQTADSQIASSSERWAQNSGLHLNQRRPRFIRGIAGRPESRGGQSDWEGRCSPKITRYEEKELKRGS